MSHLAPLRDALFGLIQSIDVTPVADEPWQFAFKHPVKQPQGYPGFCVVPARNSTRTIDPITQEGSYVFWVYLFYTLRRPPAVRTSWWAWRTWSTTGCWRNSRASPHWLAPPSMATHPASGDLTRNMASGSTGLRSRPEPSRNYPWICPKKGGALTNLYE